MVSTTSSRRAARPTRASTSWRGARPGRTPSIFAFDTRRLSTRSYVASTSSAGTSMVMPTWLFGSGSVSIESSAGIAAEFYGEIRPRLCRAGDRAREHWAGAGVRRDVDEYRLGRRARRVVAGQLGDAGRAAQVPAVVGAGDDARRLRKPLVAWPAQHPERLVHVRVKS